jgi:hypothetical protein
MMQFIALLAHHKMMGSWLDIPATETWIIVHRGIQTIVVEHHASLINCKEVIGSA